ncbi:16S rRNA (adenine(1518)-N(6)/adenine(1519)-N(6))-dimethyltransferase RsmA [Elusimicrobiota bacterium]
MGEKLGQHFLTDPETARRIAGVLEIQENEDILEIGPGKGFLTSYLLEEGAAVTGIEIDIRMVECLKNKFKNTRLRIINEDFLMVDLEEYKISKICGNIPYQLCGKIIEKTVKTGFNWKTAVLMLPDAVARRVVAEPGSSDCSFLSVMCGANCSANIEFGVDKDSFDPPPKVNSSIVKFKRNSDPEAEYFYRVVKGAFSNRRKTIKNSLSIFFSVSQEKIEEVLRSADIPQSVRAQEVRIEQFKRLANEFVNKGIL